MAIFNSYVRHNQRVWSTDRLVMTNIAMENGTFPDDFSMKTSIDHGFSIAMLNNQMVIK